MLLHCRLAGVVASLVTKATSVIVSATTVSMVMDVVIDVNVVATRSVISSRERVRALVRQAG